ncbi:DNA N-6-adenine-methyltransferase [Cereibacter sphaeroides f. sp. denitrificans]|nr:adenine methyltransferase [Cereibacter sphaeroides f. sp. denitrificans]
MSAWEPCIGISDEWYTPRHVFDALGEHFDLDVAAPWCGWAVPARCRLTEHDDGLKYAPFWHGFIWMNPPFGGRNGLVPWLAKFFAHDNGIALTPDRTSAPWWQDAADRADAILLTRGKVKFERPDGSIGGSPGAGVTLWAAGDRAVAALLRAEANGLGTVWQRSITE